MSYGSPSGYLESNIHVRPETPPGQGGHGMTRYLISFDAHAMDHIPDEVMPDPTVGN